MLKYLYQKSNRSTEWLTLKMNYEIHPYRQSMEVGFFMYYRLINMTKVSNAMMNIPKAIKSLKSYGFLSTRITAHLYKMEGQNTSIQRLLLKKGYHLFRFIAICFFYVFLSFSFRIGASDVRSPRS